MQNNTLNENNPDVHIEQFWIDFKKSIFNFYNFINGKCFPRNIDILSEKLNKLQKNKKYNIIEREIRDYIICYGIDIMRSGNGYHLNILKTNIKRWNALSDKYKLTQSNTDNDLIKCCTKSCNCKCVCRYADIGRSLFQCCLEICFSLEKARIPFGCYMENIELIVIQKNIQSLLEIANITRKIFVFDIILKHVKWILIDELIENYGSDIFKNIDINTLKGKTIAKIIWE